MDGVTLTAGFLPYSIAGAILVIAGIIVLQWRRSRQGAGPQSRYAEALNALLEGNDEAALKELRQTVQAERTNIDAYLRLGNLLRKRGAVERALRIHMDLDVATFFRRKLTKAERFRIREAIADDYMAARRAGDALHVLDSLLDLDKTNRRIRSKMVAIHERQSDWDKAFDLYEEGFKIRKEKAPEIVARYCASCGVSILKEKGREEAVDAFQQALRLDPKCPEALYRLGEDAFNLKNYKETLLYWEQFHAAVPAQAYLTFERFEAALFETGNLNRVEEVYQSILSRAPREERTLLTLSMFYARRGETDKAVDLLKKAVVNNPASAAARNSLALLHCETGEPEVALKELGEFLKDNPPPQNAYTCSNCGYQAEGPFWRCPQCLKWNTMFSRSASSLS